MKPVEPSNEIKETSLFLRVFNRKEPWFPFLVKSLFILFFIFLSGFISGIAFASKYTLVMDPQQVRCIPGYTFYLVDKHDRELVRDRLYMFLSKDLSPIYEKNTKMLKYLRALPGDRISIDENDQIYINDKPSEHGLILAHEKLGQPPENFHGNITLTEDQYWFLATSHRSFDSRYWGAVTRESIIGRAYPLF